MNLYPVPVERRRKPILGMLEDPGSKAEQTAVDDYYIETWMLPPRQRPPTLTEAVVFKAGVPLEPTRIDILLPAAEMAVLDFTIPDEPEIWAAWAVARVKREAYDMELLGFSEQIVLAGNTANVRRIHHKTRRVMESYERRFRFVIDDVIDTQDPDVPTEGQPTRIIGENNMVDKIRADNADARKRGVNQWNRGPESASRGRTQIPWAYVAGFLTSLALLITVRYLHLM